MDGPWGDPSVPRECTEYYECEYMMEDYYNGKYGSGSFNASEQRESIGGYLASYCYPETKTCSCVDFIFFRSGETCNSWSSATYGLLIVNITWCILNSFVLLYGVRLFVRRCRNRTRRSSASGNIADLNIAFACLGLVSNEVFIIYTLYMLFENTRDTSYLFYFVCMADFFTVFSGFLLSLAWNRVARRSNRKGSKKWKFMTLIMYVILFFGLLSALIGSYIKYLNPPEGERKDIDFYYAAKGITITLFVIMMCSLVHSALLVYRITVEFNLGPAGGKRSCWERFVLDMKHVCRIIFRYGLLSEAAYMKRKLRLREMLNSKVKQQHNSRRTITLSSEDLDTASSSANNNNNNNRLTRKNQFQPEMMSDVTLSTYDADGSTFLSKVKHNLVQTTSAIVFLIIVYIVGIILLITSPMEQVSTNPFLPFRVLFEQVFLDSGCILLYKILWYYYQQYSSDISSSGSQRTFENGTLLVSTQEEGSESPPMKISTNPTSYQNENIRSSGANTNTVEISVEYEQPKN